MKRLGKLPYKHDARHFLAQDFLSPSTLTIAPHRLNWGQQTQSGMLCNDELGCCTISALGHMIQCWTGNAQGINSFPVTVSDGDVREAYWATGDEDNDRYMADVLKYARNAGIGGHKIDGYAVVNPRDHELVRKMALLCGGLYVGLALPKAWQDMSVWDKVDWDTAGSWGGHAVNQVEYDKTGLWITTWGYRQKLTWEGWDWACDECWAIPSREFTDAGLAPNGFYWQAMQDRLQAL